MLKKWFISAFSEIEKISQNLCPKLVQKWWKMESLMKRCIGSAKSHRTVFRFFARYYNVAGEFHKHISWNCENISKSRPKFSPKIMKNWILNDRIGSAKPHRTVFRFFARYYDAEEVIHKRILWNWENISKSGTRVTPKIMKNWIFNEKVHWIRKTSQNCFSFFRKILQCWRRDS